MTKPVDIGALEELLLQAWCRGTGNKKAADLSEQRLCAREASVQPAPRAKAQ